MVRLLKFLFFAALVLVMIAPAAAIGFAWWEGSRLRTFAEAGGWFSPEPANAAMSPIEITTAGAVFGATWNIEGVPCRTGARAWIHYTGRPDADGLSISQVVARDIAREAQPGLSIRSQAGQLALACMLEQQYSDTDLLRLWLRRADYGEGRIGVDAAASAGFGKSADALDNDEAARLVAVLYEPTLWTRPEAWDVHAKRIVNRVATRPLGVAPVREVVMLPAPPTEPNLIPAEGAQQ